eukprot:2229055-Prymnesium_polylepis.1
MIRSGARKRQSGAPVPRAGAARPCLTRCRGVDVTSEREKRPRMIAPSDRPHAARRAHGEISKH